LHAITVLGTPNEADIAVSPPAPRLVPSWRIKAIYATGQVAQSGGFEAAIGFIFFYYTAVLGLSGSLVGAALAISLAFDAVVDPVIGCR
jgi:GPH family glycoside/pentoside/hexuronide:cation symporter